MNKKSHIIYLFICTSMNQYIANRIFCFSQTEDKLVLRKINNDCKNTFDNIKIIRYSDVIENKRIEKLIFPIKKEHQMDISTQTGMMKLMIYSLGNNMCYSWCDQIVHAFENVCVGGNYELFKILLSYQQMRKGYVDIRKFFCFASAGGNTDIINFMLRWWLNNTDHHHPMEAFILHDGFVTSIKCGNSDAFELLWNNLDELIKIYPRLISGIDLINNCAYFAGAKNNSKAMDLVHKKYPDSGAWTFYGICVSNNTRLLNKIITDWNITDPEIYIFGFRSIFEDGKNNVIIKLLLDTNKIPQKEIKNSLKYLRSKKEKRELIKSYVKKMKNTNNC